MQKVNFQGFRAQLVVSQEAAVFFAAYYWKKPMGLKFKASPGRPPMEAQRGWMKPSEMNFFNCKKFVFNHFELSLSCVIGRNLYCYAPSAGCYSPHCSTASCRLETTRNELFQREKVNLQGFRIQLVMSQEAVSAVSNHHKLTFAKPKSCILVLSIRKLYWSAHPRDAISLWDRRFQMKIFGCSRTIPELFPFTC